MNREFLFKRGTSFCSTRMEFKYENNDYRISQSRQLRELKFASEKYFRKEITAQELQDTAKTLRNTHWNLQKTSGITWIPTNDFSFYDNMLDTAVLLNAVPERYRALALSELDT